MTVKNTPYTSAQMDAEHRIKQLFEDAKLELGIIKNDPNAKYMIELYKYQMQIFEHMLSHVHMDEDYWSHD